MPEGPVMWALKLLGFAKWAMQGAWGLIRRYPLYAMLILALVVQTVRVSHLGDKLDKCEANRAALTATIADMNAKAKQARTASVTIAKESDQSHAKNLADNRARVSAYVATHRLQTQPAGISAASEGKDTGVSQVAPAEALVSVSEADLQICATDYTYAKDAYDHAQAKIRAGLAD